MHFPKFEYRVFTHVTNTAISVHKTVQNICPEFAYEQSLALNREKVYCSYTLAWCTRGHVKKLFSTNSIDCMISLRPNARITFRAFFTLNLAIFHAFCDKFNKLTCKKISVIIMSNPCFSVSSNAQVILPTGKKTSDCVACYQGSDVYSDFR